MTALSSESLVGTLRRTWAHVRSERTNDVDQIMPTVSQKVCYIMPQLTEPDPELVVLTRRDEVRRFYSDEREFFHVIDSTPTVEAASDWYLFLEAVSMTRAISSGELHCNDVAVLLPCGPDGITGEIVCTRTSWAKVFAGVPGTDAPGNAAEVAARRAAVRRLHQDFLDALAAGDAARAAALFSDDARIAVRNYFDSSGPMLSGTGRDTVERRCRAVVEAVDGAEIEVVSRVTGDWYVFAEWVLRGTARDGGVVGAHPGQRIELRVAALHPVTPELTFRGEQGYGVDLRVLDTRS